MHDDEARELVQRMRSSASALREMFDGLIDVSRLEQGAVEPALGDVELDPLLERLAARGRGRRAREGRSSCAAPPRGLRVRSDPVLLGRILQNLVVNAVRYTREGHVELSAVQHEGSVHVWFRIRGPGIPEDRREAIFAEFVRLHEDTSVQGLGLGLAIVDRLVKLLGHRVVLESLPGRGSSFRVELAAASAGARGERGSKRPTAGERGPGALAGSRVLVIDDDLDILIGMRALLEEWGAQVTLAASAEEALECVELGGPPDAVVADYRLGDALGTEVVEAIRRAVSRRVPAIVVTGSSSEVLLADLARYGLAHLSKPIAAARLRAALVELLRPDRSES